MKRTLAFILSMVMLVALFSACANTGDTNNTPANTTGDNNDPVDEPTPDDDGLIASAYGGVSVTPPGELPIVKEPVTLSIFIPQHANVEDYDDNKMTLYMEEQTGVDIEWVIVPDQDASQRVNLLLASQVDLPDVFMVPEGMSNEVVADMADQEIFLQLDDMIENLGHWYTERRVQDPLLDELMKLPDGHQYTMPKVVHSDPNSMSRRAWINQTWLDNLGLEMPTTTEDLVTVLKAFKDDDPNDNGKADEIAFMGSTNGWAAYPEDFIINSFIKFDRNSPYYLDNGKFEASYDKDAYREGLKYMHRLSAEEGLLDPATYTQDNDQLTQLFDNEEDALVGLATGGGTFIWAPMDGDRVKEYAPLEPLKGPDGVQFSWWNPYEHYHTNEWVITSECANPEVAFRFADFMYSRDVSMRNRLGEPDVDYIIPAGGEMGVDGEPATYDPVLPWGQINSSRWEEKGPTYNDFDNNGIKGDDPYELQQYLWNTTQNNYAPYQPPVEMCHNRNMYYTPEDSRRLSEINTDLNSYVQNSLAEFVTGIRDPNDDSQWEAYLNEIKALGYEEYISIVQARYDSAE
ncbi:MAG TPA: extracellular solute-binding protein [Bacillota bacterium]|nr:extracellular solute-binding protein [Bacillota bacterium]